MAIKLVVMYPRPRDIEVFEKIYNEEHVPMAIAKLAGKTKMVGAPPEEIETACAMVCLPPSEAAHASRASIEGKCTSAIR